MNAKRRAELVETFEERFGMSLEEGRACVRETVERFGRLGFEHVELADESTVTMDERRFAVVAFFAMTGITEFDDVGLPASRSAALNPPVDPLPRSSAIRRDARVYHRREDLYAVVLETDGFTARVRYDFPSMEEEAVATVLLEDLVPA